MGPSFIAGLLNISVNMADDEAIDDIMNSPSKPSSPPQQDVSRPQTASELPGGIDDEEPSAQQLEEKRPSTTLEVDPEGGVATMSESNVLPARLPPLNNGPEGLEGPNRQNIDLVSNISEVGDTKLIHFRRQSRHWFATFQKRLKGQRMMTTLVCVLCF